MLLILSSESSPQYFVTAVCRAAKFFESLHLLRKSVDISLVINFDAFSLYICSKLLFIMQMLLLSSNVRYPATSEGMLMLRMFLRVKLSLSKLPVIILCDASKSGRFSTNANFVPSLEKTGGSNLASIISDVYTILPSTTKNDIQVHQTNEEHFLRG